MHAPRNFIRVTTPEGPVFVNVNLITHYRDGRVHTCNAEWEVSEAADEITRAVLAATRLRHLSTKDALGNYTGLYEDEWEFDEQPFDHFAPWRK